MDIAIVIEGIDNHILKQAPWIYFKNELSDNDINLHIYWQHENYKAFQRPYDAMLLFVWQHWLNKELFNQFRIMTILEKYAIYRAEYPEVIQIVLNHSDMCRKPYSFAYWRPGDPILYRTPPYDRNELYPYPSDKIWAYEKVWGKPCLVSDDIPKYPAGFIGSPNGPPDYRKEVAKETSKVGIGICEQIRPYSKEEHNKKMTGCRIIVCPRGWGEQSSRHWDAWLSGKPVLTDRECDAVEMIPGVRLRENVHYLVFDEPKEIPDIVNDWTKKSRLEELERIGQNGKRAALSYNAFGRILEFFVRIKKT